jgi:hypothetical protein
VIIWIIQQFGITQSFHILESIVPLWLLSTLSARNVPRFLIPVALIQNRIIPMVIPSGKIFVHNKRFFYDFPSLYHRSFFSMLTKICTSLIIIFFGIVGDYECITGKVCDIEGAGTNADIAMEIYQGNQRVCTTDAFDYSFFNDFKRNATFKYCGQGFLLQCFGKAISSNFHVVLLMDHPAYDKLFGADPVCFDYLAHETVFIDKNSGQKVPIKHNSKSHGWSVKGDHAFYSWRYAAGNRYGYEKDYPYVRMTLPIHQQNLFDDVDVDGTILARYWGT